MLPPSHGSPELPADGPPLVTVVIPTYNERDNLAPLVRRVLEAGPDFSILVVDDNSPDGTGELADELSSKHPGRVRVLHRDKKSGIGPAYRAGFREALALGSPIIAQMDADGSHDPAALPRLVAVLQQADVVLGSRYVAGGSTRGWPLHRRLISRLGGLYARIVLGVPIADLTGGFKAYRREALIAINPDQIRSDGYCFQIETTYRALQCGCRVVEVPIVFVDRVAGKSKLSRRIVLEAMIMVWRLRFSRRRIICGS
ncbi:MAG TPA: polyprenol monophosphomannose synthase [Thermomicrobiales bacterium]